VVPAREDSKRQKEQEEKSKPEQSVQAIDPKLSCLLCKV